MRLSYHARTAPNLIEAFPASLAEPRAQLRTSEDVVVSEEHPRTSISGDPRARAGAQGVDAARVSIH